MGNSASSHALLSSVSKASLFEHRLPSDVVEHIVRFLSERPYHLHPLLFVRTRDVHALLEAPEPLRAAVRQTVCSISTFPVAAHRPLGTEVSPALIVDEDEFLAPLVAGLGSALQHLFVYNVSHKGAAWIEALKGEPCNLVELSLHRVDDTFPLEAVLPSCGRLLRLTLTFISPPSTRRLERLVENVPRLKTLHVEGLNPEGGFKHIWSSFERLEVLAIIPFISWNYGISDFYDGIALSLSGLRELTLYLGTYIDLVRATLLCVALGERLLKLSLRMPPNTNFHEQLGEIKTACPNAATRLWCGDVYMTQAMKAAGDSLLELHIDELVMPYTLTEIGHELDYAAFCTRIRRLDVRVEVACVEELLELLLTHVGRQLEQLTLDVAYPISHRRDGSNQLNLSPLALHTGNLLRLSVIDLIPPTLLRSVAVANPRLHCVHIAVWLPMHQPRPVSEGWLVRLADDFLSNCRHLVDLFIEDKDSSPLWRSIPWDDRIAGLDRLCSSLEARRKVTVRVADIFYEI